jgi:hypothetical protein
MTDLPTVTIIAYDNTDNPERTLKVIQYCRRFFNFADSILVCRRFPHGANDETIYTVHETGYEAAQQFESVTIGDYVITDHALYVSHDGCILNPDKWTNDWLEYDFVGAPWPIEIVYAGCRVGNTAFCLQSRKFMDLCSKCAPIYRNNLASDVFVCQFMRPVFEVGHGIKYAPIDVAAAFSWEINIPEFPDGRPDAFGGHKKNFRMT